MEKPKLGQFEAVTKENFEAVSKNLSRFHWEGKYDEALPLADKILEFRSKEGNRDAALVQYASSYYSAASRLWREKKVKAAGNVGRYMNTALRALEERIKKEAEKQGGRKTGMVPISLKGMTSSELDVTQSVYRRAAEVVNSVPLVKPLRELVVSKEKDPIRDFDAAALTAIRAGLKKAREERMAGKQVSPHTEIFLQTGAFDIAKRYGWKKAGSRHAAKIFKLAESFPWPPENASPEEIFNSSEKLSEYGQATRVARHLLDVARKTKNEELSREFALRAEAYAKYVSDQKAKL